MRVLKAPAHVIASSLSQRTTPRFSSAARLALMVLLMYPGQESAADPQVSHVAAGQRVGTRMVDITFDLQTTNAWGANISVQVSTNSGAAFDLPAVQFSGAGYGRAYAGTNLPIVWNANADWPGQYDTGMQVRITAVPAPEPDPEKEAPPPANGEASLPGQTMAFLYSGPNAVQSGVATGTMDQLRVAVVHGVVKDQAGLPIPGVTITIEDHPEFGQTYTRTNGEYDLALNGGTTFHVNYNRADYLALQRVYDVPWQDYVPVDDVVMSRQDSVVSAITVAPTSAPQWATSSVINDGDGRRQAGVYFPGGVAAAIIAHDGTTQAVDGLTTRLTEYTVGDNGAAAMPGDLPATVAYTYAIELGSAEAQRKEAGRDVLFNTNVYFYTDNFLGMPAGIPVPMGYYNKDTGAWVPSPDGRVIQLIGTNALGLARISLVPAGTEAALLALQALGFTDAERLMLAQKYQPCTNSLWRVPITHFSTYDCNYGVKPKDPAKKPKKKDPKKKKKDEDPKQCKIGGDLEIGNQVFREQAAIAGTPFSLNYSSRRADTPFALDIPLTDATAPTNVNQVVCEVFLAGRQFRAEYAPAANLVHHLQWDGLDVYGRKVNGSPTAQIRIGYVYDGYYIMPPSMRASFGAASGTIIPGSIPARNGITLWQEQQISVGDALPSGYGLGNWTLSPHHFYDPIGRRLVMGNGDYRSVSPEDWIIETMAGTGATGSTGDGGPATNATFNVVWDIAVAADGTIYVADQYRLRKITPDGMITNLADVPELFSISLGPDGSVYGGSYHGQRVWKVTPDGTVSVVTGNGSPGFSGDGGPATNAQVKYPAGAAVAPDGTIFIAEVDGDRIRRIGPDGIISTYAGKGVRGHNGDGGPATNALINSPHGMCLGPDGSLYFTEYVGHYVRQITPDGIINTLAGTGTGAYSGDGGDAKLASLYDPASVYFGPDGALYIADYLNHRVRRVGADGIINTVAGSANYGFAGDGGPAAQAMLHRPYGVKFGPDGSYYIADLNNYRIRQVRPAAPGIALGEHHVPSSDGGRIFVFNDGGRHLRTVDSLTGSNIYTFGYTTNGLLARVTDAFGLATMIERAENGTPLAVVAPFGQRTELQVTTNGQLTAIINPAGQQRQFRYAAGGLVTNVVDALGQVETIEYNGESQVTRIINAAGAATALGRTDWSGGYQVYATSAMGRVTSVRAETLDDGADRTTQNRPCCGVLDYQETTMPDGRITLDQEDGTQQTALLSPDPRFKMQAPFPGTAVIRTPAGLVSTNEREVAVVLDPANPLGVAALETSDRRNGAEWITVYTASNRQTLVRSPAGRETRLQYDEAGLLSALSMPGLAPVYYHYNGLGQLTEVNQGDGPNARARTTTFDAQGQISTVTQPLDGTTHYQRDPLGQVTNVLLANGQSAQYAYDANNNLVKCQPPGRPAYRWVYNAVNDPITFQPPLVSGVGTGTAFYYDQDRFPTGARRPDGSVISNFYDEVGRLVEMVIPEDRQTYLYAGASTRPGAILATNGASLAFGYDGSLVTSVVWQGSVTGRVSAGYDAWLRQRSLAVNGAQAINYQYDADGLILAAGDCVYARDPASGRLLSATLSNVVEIYAYDQFGAVTSMVAAFSGAPFFAYELQYDPAGRVATRRETTPGATNRFDYAYDAIGQVAEVRYQGQWGQYTNRYEYDANGNRMAAEIAGSVESGTYDDQDRVLTYAGRTCGHTPNGAWAAVTDATRVATYSYDALGQLRQVSQDGTNIQYVIDAAGRRVGKRVDGVMTRQFLYANDLQPVAELDGQRRLLSRFVFGQRPNAPEYLVRSGVVYKVVCDAQGSPRRVVDAATGVIAQEMDYDEFGRALQAVTGDLLPFGFGGGLFDPQTGLLRFGDRDYAPLFGRWTAQEPLGIALSLNLYTYCANNPLYYADPDGQIVLPVILALGGAAVVVIWMDRGGKFTKACSATRKARQKVLECAADSQSTDQQNKEATKEYNKQIDKTTDITADYTITGCKEIITAPLPTGTKQAAGGILDWIKKKMGLSTDKKK